MYEIRLAKPGEQETCLELERQVWNPFNWEADGSVGLDYDPELHMVAVEDGEIIGTIDGCGFNWSGKPEDLPEDGWTGIVLEAIEGFPKRASYASALGASVSPHIQAKGLSKELLKALKAQALSLGYKGMVAPVRPMLAARMPHLTISEYLETRLPDGRHFDPWVRAHESIGGKIIGSCEESAVFGGTREQWEGWAKMKLPDQGAFLFEGAINWLRMDSGYGILREDSAWLLHD